MVSASQTLMVSASMVRLASSSIGQASIFGSASTDAIRELLPATRVEPKSISLTTTQGLFWARSGSGIGG
jgi:hypothetical protein